MPHGKVLNMSTRSNIIAKLADGRWGKTYCHWDGYPEHNGKILNEHYQDQAKVDALIALGDLSILGPEIGRKHAFDKPPMFAKGSTKVSPRYAAYQKNFDSMCLAYGRDRGEKNVDPEFGDSLEALWPDAETMAEFVYVWDGQSWWLATPEAGPDKILHLGRFLAGEGELVQTVKAFGLGAIGTRTVSGGEGGVAV